MHEDVVLAVEVHPVGRDEEALERIGERGARVREADRSRVLTTGVLGDVAQARDQRKPRRHRHDPERGIRPPIAGERAARRTGCAFGEQECAVAAVDDFAGLCGCRTIARRAASGRSAR